ncbi:MAG: type II toxin-antitoxin system RelE/ParE family toxin [Deltaproteobacteria bacterium]|nr:type II toxin-antitoxin system RelE/ParE family toxin [Deltaproteobacteria bacterium]
MPRLRIPDEVVALIRGLHPDLKRKIKVALRAILNDPYCGKDLKEELAGLLSFRVSRFRLVYRVSKKEDVEIVAVGPRERIYEETLRLLQKT